MAPPRQGVWFVHLDWAQGGACGDSGGGAEGKHRVSGAKVGPGTRPGLLAQLVEGPLLTFRGTWDRKLLSGCLSEGVLGRKERKPSCGPFSRHGTEGPEPPVWVRPGPAAVLCHLLPTGQVGTEGPLPFWSPRAVLAPDSFTLHTPSHLFGCEDCRRGTLLPLSLAHEDYLRPAEHRNWSRRVL